jgi:hypothetical protein
MSARKVIRVKLQVDQADDNALIGLVSSEPDYKLSLALNRKLGLSLKNIPPVRITGDPGTDLLFSRFSDTSGSPERMIILVSNRSDKNFLIKKLRNVDYILHLSDPEDVNLVSKTLAGLKEIPAITAVFRIDTAAIKDKNLNLIIPV